MFYFNPVEGEGWKTQNEGKGSLYTHTTLGPTTRNNTHFHSSRQLLCGVQGQLRIDGTRIKTLLAQEHGQYTKRWRREFLREQSPGPQLLSQWRGNEKTLAQQEGGWQKSGLP